MNSKELSSIQAGFKITFNWARLLASLCVIKKVFYAFKNFFDLDGFQSIFNYNFHFFAISAVENFLAKNNYH